MDSKRKEEIKHKLAMMCIFDGIKEYSQLVAESFHMNMEYASVTSSEMMYFIQLILHMQEKPREVLLMIKESSSDEEEIRRAEEKLRLLDEEYKKNEAGSKMTGIKTQTGCQRKHITM